MMNNGHYYQNNQLSVDKTLYGQRTEIGSNDPVKDRHL